jgi:hypothetical protein
MNRGGLACILMLGCIAPVWSQSGDNSYLSLEEINLHISEVTPPNAKIPDNDTLIIRELDRVDAQVAKAAAIATWRDYDIDRHAKRKVEAVETIQQMRTVKCAADRDKFIMLRDKLFGLVRFDTSILWDRDEPFDTAALSLLYQGPGRGDSGAAVKECEAVQKQLNDSVKVASIVGVFDNWISRIKDSQQKLGTYREAAQKWLDLLKQRRSLLQDKLSSKTSQQQISGSLWIIMLVIGVFSTTTILLVKLFDQELQLEWVASGQVIQFVTVMILLSVIMALGLSNVLKEETLGTLLGGIAGYVLAQGVGRAAAREVSRTAAARQTQTRNPETPES